MNDIYITLYRTIYSEGSDPNEFRYITLQKACERIRTGETINPNKRKKVKDIIKGIRTGQDGKKGDLACYVFSGKYKARNMNSCIEYSGLLVIDFDKVPDPLELKKQVSQDKFVAVAFISPSGNGVKCIVKVNKDQHLHRRYFQAAADHFDQYHPVDRQGIDMARACYDSYDPDIYINPNSEYWTEVKELETFPSRAKDNDISFKLPVLYIRDDNTKYQRAVEWTAKYHTFTPGQRNHFVYRLAFLCNRLGCSEAYAAYAISADYTSTDFPQREVTAAVKSAYKHSAVHGEIILKDWTSYNIIKERKAENVAKEEIVSEICAANGIDEDHDKEFVEIATKAVEEYEQETNGSFQYWWTVTAKESDPEKISLQLDYNRLHQWLARSAGIFRYRMNENSHWIIIKSENNVVKEIEPGEVVTVMVNAIKALPEMVDGFPKSAIYNFTMNKIDSALTDKKIMAIQDTNIKFFRDTKDESYFFFENCIYKVTANEIRPLDPLNEVNKAIWAQQRAPHKIPIKEFNGEDISTYFHKGDDFQFGEWIYLLCEREGMTPEETTERAKHLCSIIGYNLHTYKDPTNPRATIFTEFFEDGRPNGGTGKSLLVHAIGHARKVIQEDGKNFNFDSAFAFQQVTADTNLVVFNDIKQHFNFERLFMAITDGLVIEQKHKGKITFPYHESPKFATTTNYPIAGTGDSFHRRMYIFEITQDFKRKHGSPAQKYGRRFFDDWSEGDWAEFYYFLMKCVQYFLKYGVKEQISDNYRQYQLLQAIGSEAAYNYLFDRVQLNQEIDQKSFNDGAIQELANEFTYKLSGRRVMIWVRDYAEFLGARVDTIRKKVDGQTRVMIVLRPKDAPMPEENAENELQDETPEGLPF